MPRKKLSRRDFLRVSALATAGAALFGCVPPAAKPAKEEQPKAEAQPVSTEEIDIVVMYESQPGSFVPDEYSPIVKERFNINVEHMNPDGNRRNVMWAAGTPPDMYMVNALGVGPAVLRKQLYPLTEFVNASTEFGFDDMLPPYKQHMWKGADVGVGDLYGIVKDWSADFSVFVNKKHLETAGVPLPPDDQPITIAEWFEIGKQVLQREGDQTIVRGARSHYAGNSVPQPGLLMDWLLTAGGDPLYTDGKLINLTANEGAKEIFNAWMEAAKQFTSESQIDPAIGNANRIFAAGQLALLQGGFWAGGAILQQAEPEMLNDFYMIPAPQWGDKVRANQSHWASATVIASASEHPDRVWQVVEWFNSPKEAPAQDRAKIGWNLPLFEELFELLPTDTPYDAQRTKVALAETAYADVPLQFNPFYSGMTDGGEDASYKYLTGDISFDEMIGMYEQATNAAIKENIDRFL